MLFVVDAAAAVVMSPTLPIDVLFSPCCHATRGRVTPETRCLRRAATAPMRCLRHDAIVIATAPRVYVVYDARSMLIRAAYGARR